MGGNVTENNFARDFGRMWYEEIDEFNMGLDLHEALLSIVFAGSFVPRETWERVTDHDDDDESWLDVLSSVHSPIDV
jgi:hypothetical protein